MIQKKVIIILAFVLIVFSASLANASSFVFEGSEYSIIEGNRITWSDSKAKAESLGGQLVSITSKAEQTFIRENLLKGRKGEFWLGAFQTSDPGLSQPKQNWEWLSGESFDYTNWQGGEPNNGGIYPADETLLSTSSFHQWKWNDQREQTRYNIKGFILEKKLAAPSAPTPVPAGVWILGVGLSGLLGLKRKFSKA